ncbi:unnamed protein product [Symbiodinium microadriaticum]|nr:unnamed protein product [Symbiodinium microadriaticum]
MLLRVLQRAAKCIQSVFFCTSRCDIVPSQAGSREAEKRDHSTCKCWKVEGHL